ncbi:MAG: FAD-binding oxidoreductase [Deltaproteobacteria bacterium]|nr:FAD-binding oxidoreductase [Deltaproteobacteria bacterium]
MIDVAIVGAGVAGLSVARALPQEWSATVCAARPGASQLPTAICHPFPGRSAGIEHGYRAFAAAYRAMSDTARELCMVRPVNGEQARLWVTAGEQLEAARAEGIFIERLEPAASSSRFPILGHQHAVVYRPAMVLSPPQILSGWRSQLAARGVAFADAVTELRAVPGGWRLMGAELEARRVVLCPGARLGEWFPELPIRQVAGELATVEGDLDHALSGEGIYLAPRADGRLCIGATRHPPGEPLATSEIRRRLLGHRLVRRLDHGFEPDIWKGVRVTVPADRRPLVGAVPEFEQLFVSGAFGSKGFYWAPLAGLLLADEMTGRQTVPKALSSARLDGYRSPLIA